MDYYYDDYYDEYYDQAGVPERSFNRELSFDETVNNCVHPSLRFAGEYIVNFIVINLTFCVLVLAAKRLFPGQLRNLHVLSCVCGVALFYRVLEHGYYHFVQLAVTLYVMQWLLHRWFSKTARYIKSPFILIAYGIGNLLLSELLEPSPEAWNRVRGTQMILLMKVLSLAFDTEDNMALRNQLGVLSYCGYILCPANVILGPWVSFSDYLHIWRASAGGLESKQTRSTGRRMLIHVFRLAINALMAVAFLLTSNCMIDYLLAPAANWKWVRAYGRALSFRTSHYFIAYLSQSSMLAAAADWSRADDDRSLMVPVSSLYRVSSPLAVEFPRSLVQVVTAWNIPMHLWLKRYIFRTTKRPFGTGAAIALTYIISSLLHGLHYRLWITLLTIGSWTYVEHEIRKKLAAIYSACVLVGKCPEACVMHQHKGKSLFSIVINALFFLLNVFNLIYLGCIFESTEGPPEEVHHDTSIFGRWTELNYASHWLLVFAYLFYFII
ncbi:protein-serine O-palmitoleoyltransferase porcupine [Anopheles ziemanni]|uniref:protein-serine O-palmitoleoyltransferase porcupine n=1 Tax=Anopheles coustani TaxID=139045 RepID=UPI002659C193|nr:protein-serine O-palmitoleoyltransferase porcupine [Anopheles coustani]XP_058166638.1 protein-serine O-palmitoleoyltransferase porcupine [Anopheles ziemanni]